jgi:SAM-dependent methyltransferase
MPDFCNYEGSDYKQRFWTEERRYEDLVERQALGRLLPTAGNAIADLGAAYGRLADLYGGYRHVYLVDYSRSLLRQARETWGSDPRFTFVAADIRHLPLASAALDTVVTVRVLHHLPDIRPAIVEAARVLAPTGHYVIEYASKRNLKAIARYLTGRQRWSPFAPQPVEFAELNYDFHPGQLSRELAAAGLDVEERRAVSLFRLAALKRRLGARRLAWMDRMAQPLASIYPLSPSVMLRARKPCGSDGAGSAPAGATCLACPRCHGELELGPEGAACPSCNRRWPLADGIYDFTEA